MYRCPSETMDCETFKNKLAKIPFCVPNKFNGILLLFLFIFINNILLLNKTDPVKIGNGVTYRERYYFDVIDNKCKKFYFTGFNGNLNNFPNEYICNRTCFIRTKMIEKRTPITKMVTEPSPTTTQPTSSLLTESTSTPESTSLKLNNSCQWICNLDCQFGYKIDFKTNCYKCDCIDMKISECGVPCWNEGAKGCLHPVRANSRPLCVCNQEYSGSYCEVYNKIYNFSVELDKQIQLNETISNDIEL